MFENWRWMHRALMLALGVGLASGAPQRFGPVYADAAEFRVNTTTEGTQTTYYLAKSVAMDKQGNSVVVWHGNGPADDAGVFAQRFNATGEPLGEEFRVNTTTEETQGWPVVAMAGDTGSFAIAWTKQIPHPISENTVYCRAYNSNGVPLTDEFQIASGHYLTSVLSIATDDSGNFAVFHRLDPGSRQLCSFYVHQYNAQGEPLGGPIRIARTSLANGFGAIAVDDDGDFVVAWDDGDDGAVHAQRFNSSGQKVGKPMEVASSGWACNVAMDAVGNFGVTWDDRTIGTMRCRLFNADGTPRGEAFPIADPSGGYQTAMTMQASGDFALAWDAQVQPDPGDRDVYAQRFDADGNQMGDPFLVNSTIAGHQTGPSLAANASGDIVIVWNGNGPGDDRGVFGERYKVVPTPRLAIDDVALAEGDSGTKTFTFTVTRSGDTSGSVSVDYDTEDGSATVSDGDYEATSGTLTFSHGQTTGTIEVTVNSDAEVELDEAFAVNLSGATGGAVITDSQGVGTILNDDGAQPECSLAINDVSKKEGDGGPTTIFTFTVTRSGDLSGTVTVDFATVDGTATLADNDYLRNADTLLFNANDTSQTIDVVVVGDQTKEPHETFAVNLFNPTGGATITDAQAVGTIRNDDHK